MEKWEQTSAHDPDQEEEDADEEGGEGQEECGGGNPDGPVDFTIKAEQGGGGSSPAEEANEMAAFLASAVRSAAQFQVRHKYIQQCSGPHVFGPPGSGSGSISQRYGSGSGPFYHQAKIVRKTVDFYCFVTPFGLFISKKLCKCTFIE